MRGLALTAWVALGLGIACGERPAERVAEQEEGVTDRPIEAVLEAHREELMAIPGVVGTSLGRCDAEPCIRVLAVRASAELRERIPDRLDGYRVEVQETGQIRARDSL